jgi:hypothetical protein
MITNNILLETDADIIIHARLWVLADAEHSSALSVTYA